MTIGIISAKYPAPFGIKNLTIASPKLIINSTISGLSCRSVALPTINSENHAAAPVVMRTFAIDNAVAITKKLLQPRSRSNSCQLIIPIRGSNIITKAISAGTAGCMPCMKSVNHNNAVMDTIKAARISIVFNFPNRNSLVSK